MKKSKKFVLAALALLAAITMALLPLAGFTNTEDNTSGNSPGTVVSAGIRIDGGEIGRASCRERV